MLCTPDENLPVTFQKLLHHQVSEVLAGHLVPLEYPVDLVSQPMLITSVRLLSLVLLCPLLLSQEGSWSLDMSTQG